jgi:crotonobetainyl-CoA:carnitine CoA-transferase CaiB-like acyl-CoA transferase
MHTPSYPKSAAASDNSRHVLMAVWNGLGGSSGLAESVSFIGGGSLRSHFLVADFAAGFVGVAALAAAELAAGGSGSTRQVCVDRALASSWFHTAIEPQGWRIPPFWHPLCRDYQARDGWVRLHTNIPSHCDAVVTALGVPEDPTAVAAAVARWQATELECAVLAAGGAAAEMRSREAWLTHPQGRAIAQQRLVDVDHRTASRKDLPPVVPNRPLAGIRVLDLTRGVAGPVASRTLAAFGAEVLRIDPPLWEEPAVVPDVCLGKRRARLDLRKQSGRRHLLRLIGDADVLIHGYRPGVMDWLRLDDEDQEHINPGLIDVTLNAYGWAGPWSGRRGFDSLVQMSSGMSHEAMASTGSPAPVHLPMQALDQATGYLMASAAIRGLTERRQSGRGRRLRCSLARTAEVLIGLPRRADDEDLTYRGDLFVHGPIVPTGWGPARRLPIPVTIDGVIIDWDVAAGPLGSHDAAWQE